MEQMKKMSINAMVMFLIIALVLPTTIIIASASSASNNETIKSSATVENDFADNRVIVILTQEASLSFIDYTPEDFSEVDCKSVFCVTTAINSMAKEAIENIHRSVTKGENLIVSTNLDLSDFRNMICLEINNAGKKNVINAISSLQKRDDVYFACPDYQVTFETGPVSYTQDTLSQISYTQPQDIYNLLGISGVWELLESNQMSYTSTPRVAVIDSGISHSKLSGRIVDTISADLTNFGDEYDSSIGVPEEMMGTPIDDRGHGTFVAGIIASVVEPNYGEFDNMYYNFNFASIKVGGNENETTNIMSVIAAINYVNDLNIPIINMSNISVIPASKFDLSILFQNAISGYQGLIICAAGNNGAYLKTEYEDDDAADSDIYPAALIADNLITVGACDLDGNRVSISNWGKMNVDLFAPGELIFSYFPESLCSTGVCEDDEGYENSHVSIDIDNDGLLDNGYHCLTATSFAAPWVTGVATMILAFNPNLSADTVKDIILSTVDEYESLEDLCTTGGRLNAYEAIMEATNYCSHDNFDSYTSNGSDSHSKRCSVCNHISYEGHDLFVYADNGEDGVTIKCSICNYTYTCYDGVAEYGYCDGNGHYVSCTCGCYSFIDSHDLLLYTQTSSMYTHNLNCSECGTYADEHTWVETSTGYRCTKCLKTATIIPGIMQIPVDEELLTASNDDPVAEDALLPKKEEDLVTE